MGRYAVAWGYLGGFIAVQGVCRLLSGGARGALMMFASTSVANLEHGPAGCLAVSAFLVGGGIGGAAAWVPLIAAGMFGACRAIGGTRTVAVCAAGHVIGTLVSESIVGWRVAAGAQPASFLHLTDVGPSYVVVSALAAAMAGARWAWRDRPAWIWRILAAAAMALLVYPGRILAGLGSGDLAAVGHATAIVTTLVLLLILRGQASGQVAAMPPTDRPIR